MRNREHGITFPEWLDEVLATGMRRKVGFYRLRRAWKQGVAPESMAHWVNPKENA